MIRWFQNRFKVDDKAARGMIITKPYSSDKVIEGIFRGHWFHAKVDDKRSLFGIKGGRVLEILIAEGSRRPVENISDWRGYVFNGTVRNPSLKKIGDELLEKLDLLPLLSKPKPTPTVAELAASALKKSPFQGFCSDEGCFCYGEDLLVCKEFMTCQALDCHAGYKHKSRLDGVTIKQYPPKKRRK